MKKRAMKTITEINSNIDVNLISRRPNSGYPYYKTGTSISDDDRDTLISINDKCDDCIFEYIRPIIGALFLQLRTPISDPLNEVTWFVAVLLVMKIVLSIANLHKKGETLMIILSVICAVLYIYNEQYRICENLPIIGFHRCMPFFFIGHLCKQKNAIHLKPETEEECDLRLKD